MNGHSSGPATEGTGSSGLSSPTGFESLPATLMCDLLLQDSITMSEKAIFDAVMRWAQVRTQPSGGWQGQVTAAGGSKATDASRTSSGQQEVTGLLQPLSPTSISRSLEAMAAADAAVKVEEVCQVLALVRYPLMRQQVRAHNDSVCLQNADQLSQSHALERGAKHVCGLKPYQQIHACFLL